MVTDNDNRDKRTPGMFLRRVEELLFAVQQVDALEAQLFPVPEKMRVLAMSTDEYMSRLAYGVLVLPERGQVHVPPVRPVRPVRGNGGTWTISGLVCTYERDNIVKLGADTVRLGTPSHAQWQRGVEVLRLLAGRVLEQGCGVAAPIMRP